MLPALFTFFALSSLPLPVGGRRYSPTLENLVDFSITEDIAVARPGRVSVLEQGRLNFQRPLRAAVRLALEAAKAELRAMGRIT